MLEPLSLSDFAAGELSGESGIEIWISWGGWEDGSIALVTVGVGVGDLSTWTFDVDYSLIGTVLSSKRLILAGRGFSSVSSSSPLNFRFSGGDSWTAALTSSHDISSSPGFVIRERDSAEEYIDANNANLPGSPNFMILRFSCTFFQGLSGGRKNVVVDEVAGNNKASVADEPPVAD